MYTKKLLLPLGMGIIGLSIVAGCHPMLPDTPDISPVEKGDLTGDQLIMELTPVMQSFLDSQYQYALRKETTPKWEDLILTGGKELQKRLDSELTYQNAFESYYSDYTSTIDLSSATITVASEELVHVKNVREKYTLTTISREDHGSVTTRATYPYDFSFQKIDGAWKILNWEEKHFLYPEGRWYAPDPEQNLRDRNLAKKQQARTSSAACDRDIAGDDLLHRYCTLQRYEKACYHQNDRRRFALE